MHTRSTLTCLSLVAAVTLTATVPVDASTPDSGPPHASHGSQRAARTGAQGGAPGGAVQRSPSQQRCPRLSDELPWYGDNRAKLQRTIDERGTCSASWRGGEHRPVAVFDWDNTVVKNDTTDATIVWALEHDKILRPRSWADTSRWLTPAAHRALTESCGTETPVGSPLPTSTDTDCADEILQIRGEAETMDGEEAFAGEWNHRRTVPRYAWVAQLFAGHTPEELRSYARRARAEAMSAPVGSVKEVGSHLVPAYSRYYPQQRDLIRTLKRAGFDVYIVSAGFEPLTEGWSGGVGIDRAHTIGIRSVLDDGKVTTWTRGCGNAPASKGETIPYIDGKRCAINQEIHGVRGAEAWRRQAPRDRIALGAGDADTDVTFVADATGSRLVLNRRSPEIMCRAYDNADGRWVVNPMFIEPLPPLDDPYPCATDAYTHPDGTSGPVRRTDGSVIPDQQDTAHG